MTTELFANNAAFQLASGCANTDTSLVLNSTVPAALQAAGQWRALITDSNGSEYIIVPGGQSGPTVTGVTRGAEGTTATGHSQGAWVTHIVTAGSLGAMVFNAAAVAKVQAAGGQTILYLDRHTGSDSNDGLSAGSPLATLDKAVQTLNQGVGGLILISSVQPGAYTLSAPVHSVTPITIESLTMFANNEIDRGFGTPNSRSVWDAVTTLAGTTVTSATAAFTSSDVNRIVEVYGAGTGGGTYYDFISSVTDGSHVVVANGSGTAIARPAANDTAAVGIRMRIYGDWNRVVTDAAITSGTAILTSATAAFTTADIGTEVVIGGAGHGGQALRGTILSVQSGTQATILGRAAATVTGARCVIGLIAGDMITWHVPNCGLRNVYLVDPTTGQNRIGAAIKYVVDDGYPQSSGQHSIENGIISNTDPASAWEHGFEVDGSWNQGGNIGVRKTGIHNLIVFGCRRPTEGIRINTAVHMYVTGGGSGGAAPTASVPQGIMILDPARTKPSGSATSVDVHFAGFDGIDCAYYSEGQYTTYTGGRLGAAGLTLPSGRYAIGLGPVSSTCYVSCANNDATQGATQTAQNDQGTANLIWTNRDANNTLMDGGSIAGGGTLSPKIDVAKLFKAVATGSTLTVGAPARTSGTLGTSPRGSVITIEITNSSGGTLTVTWSGSYKQAYTAPANGKTNVVAFIYDGTTWNQNSAQGPDF